MINILAITLGKLIILASRILNIGSGSTWPGHIALKLNANFIKDILNNSKIKIIIIAGTNGKTTTDRLITSIIREDNKSYLQNKEGANLSNGLASTLIRGSTPNGKLIQDYLIFETDENALPYILEQTNPDYLICLNLFRDQLDRYGEVYSIGKKWATAFEKLTKKTTLILNADDPLIAYLSTATESKSVFFGLDIKSKETLKHGADTIYCPSCSCKLDFKQVFFSHLGDWKCTKCTNTRPKLNITKIDYYPLPGTYNKYNALAAALFSNEEKISSIRVKNAFKSFTPAFGRGESLTYKNKKIQLFLSKNPTGFNESLETVINMGAKNIMIVINDNIPDGTDISWIWDINFKNYLEKDISLGVAGGRVYDIALRLKYEEFYTHIFDDLNEAIDKMVDNLDKKETLYILPNYSAMLETRKILTGKKIL